MQVSITGDDAVTVIDFDEPAPLAFGAGEDDNSGRGRKDVRAIGCLQIDAGRKAPAMIERIAPRSERTLDAIMIEWCAQWQGIDEFLEELMPTGIVARPGRVAERHERTALARPRITDIA